MKGAKLTGEACPVCNGQGAVLNPVLIAEIKACSAVLSAQPVVTRCPGCLGSGVIASHN